MMDPWLAISTIGPAMRRWRISGPYFLYSIPARSGRDGAYLVATTNAGAALPGAEVALTECILDILKAGTGRFRHEQQHEQE
jgi:hypothetical protein